MTFEALLKKAASADEVAQRLSHLLAAWRTKPAPELADALESMPLPATAPVAAGWTAAADCDELERDGLLKLLPHGTIETTSARLRLMQPWPPDPRTATALKQLVETLRWGSEAANSKVYVPAFELLVAQGDPRCLIWLPTLVECWKVKGKVLARLKASVAAAIGALDASFESGVPALTPRECDWVADAVGSRAFLRGRTEEETNLLAAIYAQPSDDGLRAVYADMLLERSEPWGEVISLQLSGTLSEEQSARLRRLLDHNQKRWLGPIAPYLDSFEISRGFLSEATVRLGGETLPPCGPQWSTLESIDFGRNAIPETARTWVKAVRPHLKGLKRVSRAPSWLLKVLVVPGTTALLSLEECTIDATSLEVLRALPGLEKLAGKLGVADVSAALEEIAGLRALRELRLSSASDALVGAAVRHLGGLKVGVVSLETPQAQHALCRGFDGKLSELWTGTRFAREHSALWQELPPDALTRVVLSHEPMDPQEAAGWFAGQRSLDRIDAGFSTSSASVATPPCKPLMLAASARYWAVVSADLKATLYDPKRLHPLLQQDLYVMPGPSVISPDARWTAITLSGGLQILRFGAPHQGMEIRRMIPVGFSDDGLRLWCADGDGVTTCIELATNQTLRTLRQTAQTFAIDREGLVVLVDAPSGRTGLYLSNSDQPVRVLEQTEGGLCAALAGGRLFTLDANGQLRLTDTILGPLLPVGAPLWSRERAAATLSVTPDGRRAVVVAGDISVVEVSSGACRRLDFEGLAVFAPDGRLVTATADGLRVIE